MVQGRQQTYLGWFHDNLAATGNHIDATAVTEYDRTCCRPSVLHGGFQLYRTVPIDAAVNQSLTANKLTLPILLLSPVRSPDPEALKAQMIAVVQPMASGPISAELVLDSGHFVAEENPAFVTGQQDRQAGDGLQAAPGRAGPLAGGQWAAPGRAGAPAPGSTWG